MWTGTGNLSEIRGTPGPATLSLINNLILLVESLHLPRTFPPFLSINSSYSKYLLQYVIGMRRNHHDCLRLTLLQLAASVPTDKHFFFVCLCFLVQITQKGNLMGLGQSFLLFFVFKQSFIKKFTTKFMHFKCTTQ